MPLDLSVVVPVGTAVVAVGGVVFAALKFNREDAGKVVSQQSVVLQDMHTLNERLHADLARAVTERDLLLGKVTDCNERIEELTGEIAGLKGRINDLESAMGAV